MSSPRSAAHAPAEATAEINAEVQALYAWARLPVPQDNAILTWAPPVPILLTGVRFSSPVVVEKIFVSSLVAASDESYLGEGTVVLPDEPLSFIPLTANLLSVGGELRVVLPKPFRGNATVVFSERAFRRWLSRGGLEFLRPKSDR